ncbi:MAG: hypothetical protein IKJ73_06890 [Lachnospiraceae bacterium]|nr:hypothetical protein [Lachnospiraceae bacterium]
MFKLGRRITTLILVIVITFCCLFNSDIVLAEENTNYDETYQDDFSFTDEAELINAANSEHSEVVSYYVHQEAYGDTIPVTNGGVAGNCGTNKRLEAFFVTRTSKDTSDIEGTIRYSAHSQNIGWTDWVSDGALAGSSGKSLRMEAIKIELTGELSEKFDVYYKTYMSNYGWLDWAKNGEISGTVGFSGVIEGVQILLVLKDSEYAPSQGRYASLTKDNMNTITYSGHVEKYGDMAPVTNGALCGTTGESKRIEAIKIKLSHGANQIYGTLNYNVHVEKYGWMDKVTENKVAGTTGESKRLEAISISLSGDIATYCDVYYRVHCERFGWLGWAKNGEYAGSAGYSYRLEAIQIKILPKGSPAPGKTTNCYRDNSSTTVTMGYDLLEPYLDKIVSECTNSSMTKEQKLKAVYDYVRTNYTYRTLSNDCPSNFRYHEYYAYQTVTSGGGNCYGLNFLFGHLAKKVGYDDVVFYKGYVGTRRDPHGWVEIGGLIYDPQLHYANSVNLYGVENGTPYIYHYN